VRRWLALAALGLVFAGCPKRGEIKLPPPADANEAIDRAAGLLAQKKYKQAAESFTFVIFNYPGSRQASDAQFWLAETYYESGDFDQAQTEFDFYLKNFPNGRFEEEATYKLGESYFKSSPPAVRDQTKAQKARQVIREFVDDYPASPLVPAAESLAAAIEERLAAKELNAARLYFKAGEYRSALTYYEYLASTRPDMSWTGFDRYQYGVAQAETGDTAAARVTFEAMLTGPYEQKYQDLARARLAP
jgi:outer membrane protein assembly factor BamD